MAANPVISKIKLANGTVVDLKDAAGRANLDTLMGTGKTAGTDVLGAAAWLDVDSSLTDAGTGVATTGTIKSYVDSQVGAINKFDVVIAEAKGGDGADKNNPKTTASASTMYQLTLVQDANAEAGTYVEFITVRSGKEGSYTYAWEKIGSTKADLTGYVEKTQKIAGIDLADDITDSELKTALGLKALAYKDTATGSTTLSTVDSITMKKVTVAGNAAVTTADASATLTKADYTPAGTVSGTVTANGTVDVVLADASTKTEADITYASYTPAGTIAATSGGDFQALKTAAFGEVSAATTGAVQIEGENSKPDITISASTTSVLSSIKDAAVLPTFSEGAFTAATWTGSSYTAPTWTGSSYSAPSLGAASSAAFANEGIVATVNTSASAGASDYELLVFASASTSNAVTAQGSFSAGSFAFGTFSAGDVTFGTFAGGSKAADTFSAGSAMTFNTAAALNSATTAALDAAPAFTGKYYANATTADTALKTVAFTGTAADVKASKVEYVKPVVSSATFTGSSANISAAFSGSTAASILTTGVSYKAAASEAAFSVDVTPEVSAITSSAKSISITVSAG